MPVFVKVLKLFSFNCVSIMEQNDFPFIMRKQLLLLLPREVGKTVRNEEPMKGQIKGGQPVGGNHRHLRAIKGSEKMRGFWRLRS